MAKGYLKTEDIILEYDSSTDIQQQFHSLYMYALYLCGDDFEAFDDRTGLHDAIKKTETKYKLIE